MIELSEEIVEPKVTTVQLSPTHCDGYFAFAKGACTGNQWQALAAWPSTSKLGTFEQFKEAARQQVLRWSGETESGETVTIKFSKVALSD